MPRPKPSFDTHKHYFLNMEIIEPEPTTYNNNTLVTIICNNNNLHNYKLSVNQIKNQKRDPTICPYCIAEIKTQNNNIQYSFVKQYADKYNLEFEPKQTSYNRWTNDKLIFKCKKCGFQHEIKALAYWEKTQPVYDCPQCKLYIGKSQEDIDNIFDVISNRNLIYPIKKYTQTITKTITPGVLSVLSDINDKWDLVEYHGTKIKCLFVCKSCGNEKYILPLNMKGKNVACRQCFLNLQKKQVEIKLIEICRESNIFFTDESQFEYKTVETNISFTCNNCGNIFTKTWADITGMYYNLHCPHCHIKAKSKKEHTLYTFIREQYSGEIIRNCRTTISPYEIDIFIPELKLGFEFCGILWHSDKFIVDNNYHANKTKLCREKDIKLITIFEDEWDDKIDICKSKIQLLLNLPQTKMYARNCIIKNVPKEDAVMFLQKTHLQGSCVFDIALGLYNDNTLVALSTFVKTKKSKQHDIELNRFSVLQNTVILGGFSKLLSHFIHTYDFFQLGTFADLRWSYGDLYAKNGFEKKYEITPRYSYVGNDTKWKRKHRFGFTKTRLIAKYGNEYACMSEKEITDSVGLYRIYDCGYIKYVLYKGQNK